MKETKDLKRQAARAERFAGIGPDNEYAQEMSNLAAAFRAQAEVLKREKKDKKERKKEKEK